MGARRDDKTNEHIFVPHGVLAKSSMTAPASSGRESSDARAFAPTVPPTTFMDLALSSAEDLAPGLGLLAPGTRRRDRFGQFVRKRFGVSASAPFVWHLSLREADDLVREWVATVAEGICRPGPRFDTPSEKLRRWEASRQACLERIERERLSREPAGGLTKAASRP